MSWFLYIYGCFQLTITKFLTFLFPQLLLRPKFSAVEKIKTIGSTYMAASGLSPGNQVGYMQSMDAAAHLVIFLFGILYYRAVMMTGASYTS